ncbi:MAG: hypothetical protein KF729_34190, partial [Sandaracinaceae bacterium]|nr:hypothetical protein [Sandaracinaceae bacterium]
TKNPLVQWDVRGLCPNGGDARRSENHPNQRPDGEGEAAPRQHVAEPGAIAGGPPPKYELTCAMLERYHGEDLGQSEAFGDSVVRYLTPDERSSRLVTVEDGLLMQGGAPFDTGDGGGIYVMDTHGNIYASTEQSPGEFHHSSLLAGADVAAAGELEVCSGQVTHIDGESGHYRPGDEHTDQAVHELRSRGATIDDRHVG